MRACAVKATNRSAALDGLVFFTQCVDELLFDHSHDTYRAPALNTQLRAIELEVVASQLQDTDYFARTLPLFLEEFQKSISDDVVLERSQAARLHAEAARIQVSLQRPSSVLPIIRAMHLELEKYPINLRRKIRRTVLISPTERREIRALASTLMVQVELEGYSRRFAYFLSQRLLRRRLRNSATPDPAKLLDAFLGRLPPYPDDKPFSVLLMAASRFEDYAEQVKRFSFSVLNDPPHLGQLTREAIAWLDTRTRDERFLLFDKVDAADPLKAKEQAELAISTFRASVDYVTHSDQLTTSNHSIVFEPDVGGSLLRRAPDPMECGREELSLEQIRKVTAIIGEVLQGDHLGPSSTYRIRNALHYHAAALHAGHPENQIVDLWAALEGLLLNKESHESRITQVMKALRPSLLLSYIDDLFLVLSREMTQDQAAIDALKAISLPGNEIQKTAAFCVCNDLASIRDDCLSKLDKSHPLLKFRIEELGRKFSSRHSIRATIQAHGKKVDWHLNRIYFTRNSIVHTAESLPYLTTLVQHLHSYLDTAIRAVAAVAVRSDMRTDLEQINSFLSSSWDFRLASLNAKEDTKCDLSNYCDLLVGKDNPVTQFVT